ncbi:cysteine proteinase [Suhomyces tanzawaensis NRRL Y-17324]|uniref:Ubiquitin carboxyl-terminal hydrolase n=1 Tax=Suhomyces tanzawaensis NRRL Y-17324 TaxID=984487 RepID=A0A1E4SDB7_9ASCO|nr:cysteine proteinase [Suhomyces tanzawaensis NRRL Y-17324]ODV77473.1 cysteine proteinase [Suhomyces tanzawaensis NRRL Y-17324]
MTISQVDTLVPPLYQALIDPSPSLAKVLNYQVSLLEIFTHEVKKLDRINVCDHELAYVAYTLTARLNKYAQALASDKTRAFCDSIRDTLDRKKQAYDQVRAMLEGTTTTQLQKVLLIDYRATKDFNHNHINYSEIINIEPSIVQSLFSLGASSVTDQDLESKLKLHLPEDKFQKFQNRYKYDMVVFYNFRYGPSTPGMNRFQALIQALIDEDTTYVPSKNPFNTLTELLMFNNKYISSRLRNHPCFLIGGVYAWHQTFGDKDHITRPNGSSPYLKNFGEYLSTANTTSETPISNTFTQASSRPVSANTHIGATAYEPDSPPVQQAPRRPSRTPSLSSTTSSITKAVSKNSSNGSSTSSNGTTNLSSSKSASPVKFLEQYTTGLVNLGNSCYMNCIIQCLGATPQLTKFFFPTVSAAMLSNQAIQSYRQHINVNNKLGSKGILTTNFVTLLVNMFNNNGKSFSPNNFKKVMGSLSPGGQFASFDQQDCNEFLNFLLDGLHEDLNQIVIQNPEEKKAILELTPEQEKTRELLPIRLASTIEWERYLKLNFSIIVDYFQGQYLSQLRCLECELTSTSYNAFSSLSLPIPEKLGSLHSQVLLDDCLKEFTTTELLDDNNKWHCPRCKKFTKLTKKISITRLPQVLIVHFKRFKITPQGYFNKLDKFVVYPVQETLDLTKYWPGVGTILNKNSDVMSVEKEEQILSSLPVRNQVPPFRYKLYGVANHFGNLTTGHYTSYVYKENDNKKTRGWCYFDDSKVTYNCSPSQVLNKNAYCLFYQRV